MANSRMGTVYIVSLLYYLSKYLTDGVILKLNRRLVDVSVGSTYYYSKLESCCSIYNLDLKTTNFPNNKLDMSLDNWLRTLILLLHISFYKSI